jgi:hypothetical protein
MKPAYSDKFLMEETKKLKERFEIKTFFETGTHIGISTSLLSEVFERVYSAEINESFYNKAKQNNINNKNVIIENRNSVDLIRKNLQQEQKGVCFFLDAHWGNYWPLLDELRTIAEKNVKPVIIIHDFYVPDLNGQAKFHFDKYKGKSLDFNFVEKEINLIYGGSKNYTHYCIEQSEINSGVGFFTPKINKGEKDDS